MAEEYIKKQDIVDYLEGLLGRTVGMENWMANKILLWAKNEAPTTIMSAVEDKW